MNATIDQKAPLSPHDPAYYAPRAPRDGDPARLPRLGDTRGYRPPATSITDTTIEAQLEDAVRESLRHPLDPEAVEEPPEIERSGLLGVVGRFAAAVGAADLGAGAGLAAGFAFFAGVCACARPPVPHKNAPATRVVRIRHIMIRSGSPIIVTGRWPDIPLSPRLMDSRETTPWEDS